MVVKHINSDAEFLPVLEEAEGKLVVVDFFATWCGPCQQIAPFFEQLSNKYPQAVFAKVDVDKCRSVAGSQGVTAMPTFIFYMNKSSVDTLRGGNPQELENKVKRWVESSGISSGQLAEVDGQVDLMMFVMKKDIECLNESSDHNFDYFLTTGGASHLESDVDEQMIISIPFNQPVKLHSLKFKGPQNFGPKTVKVFINVPCTFDFDQASHMEPVQTLEFTENQIMEGEIINLRYVKFQNVQNVLFFIVDNQGGMDTTRINQFKMYGTPLTATNMQDFKRVAGKAGEAH